MGRKSVGFVNPTLYSYPTYFNDIVYSNNLCDQGSSQATAYSGFGATISWDPVSGPYTVVIITIFAIIIHTTEN